MTPLLLGHFISFVLGYHRHLQGEKYVTGSPVQLNIVETPGLHQHEHRQWVLGEGNAQKVLLPRAFPGGAFVLQLGCLNTAGLPSSPQDSLRTEPQDSCQSQELLALDEMGV